MSSSHSRILEELVANDVESYQDNDTHTRVSSLVTTSTTLPKSGGVQIVTLSTYFQEIVFTIAAVGYPVISFIGIVFNSINITVFLTIGFSNTVNISLLGLAVSDLGSLVTLFWVGICYNPLLKSGVLPFIVRDVAHLTGCWPHVVFCRASGWITAFVAFERFLCIAFPLKVKQILTAREVKIIVCAIYFFTFASGIPLYYAHRFGSVFVPELNVSMLGVTYSHDRELVETFAIPMISVVPGTAAFCLTAIFTTGLVYKLYKKSSWRANTANTNSGSNDEKVVTLTSRDDKLARMMLAVSTIFITCFAPFVVLCIVLFVFPEFGSWYGDVYLVAVGFSFVFEGINSSVNIFVYYRMNSKYREVFDVLWDKVRKRNCEY